MNESEDMVHSDDGVRVWTRAEAERTITAALDFRIERRIAAHRLAWAGVNPHDPEPSVVATLLDALGLPDRFAIIDVDRAMRREFAERAGEWDASARIEEVVAVLDAKIAADNATPIREFPFDDPIACSGVTLVVNGPQPSFSDGTVGVLHDRCDWLADVTPDLDAFYCQACQRNGRISGAWAVDCVRSVRAALAREWRKTGRT